MESQAFLSWPELLKQVALNKYKFGNQTSKSNERNSDEDESSSSTSSSSSSSDSTSGSSDEASSSDSTSSSTTSSSSNSDSSTDSSDEDLEKNANTFKNNYRKLPITLPLSISNELAELSCNQQPLTNSFKLLFCNINSVSTKMEELKEILQENQPEILCISETWLNEKLKNKHLAIDGYYFHRNDREKHGGGLLTYVKNEIPSTLIKNSTVEDEFEYQVINVFNIILVNFNRTQDVDIYSNVELLGQIADKYEKIIVIGDLNVNFLSSDYKTQKCQEIFQKSCLNLRSREATRGENGSDWTLTKGVSAYVSSKDTHLSDHSLQIIKCFVKDSNNYHCL